ncbi:barstar family protein [Kitasatospora azatica]|uniref:barstar family protein n=1 Tax=Kitasatospora azatica TaxID=58347 RepID=UPI000B3022F7|nr:barstar family protein [Kitasatospora azatica]
MDGSNCRTSHGLFTAWAAGLGFPAYFGHNWNAFRDCLRETVSRAATTGRAGAPPTVLVRRAGGLLADEPDRALNTLMLVLGDIAGASGGEPALLLLLEDEPDRLSDLGRRLAAAGWVTSLPGSGA